MGDKSKINWCDATWNPVTGCTPAGEGCRNCYAARLHNTRHEAYKAGKLQQCPQYANPFSTLQLHPDRLDMPMRWRKPRTVFVNSMSDLFHEDVPTDFILAILNKVVDADDHDFIALTKRPERARHILRHAQELYDSTPKDFHLVNLDWAIKCGHWPIENLVLGVSCSTQAEVDRLVPVLLATPADRRIVSLEPLVEGVDIRRYLACRGCGTRMLHNLPDGALACCPEYTNSLSGVIVGGESGPNARPMHPDWVRSLRDQCAEAGTPFFFKQWGDNPPMDAYTSRPGVNANMQAAHGGRLLDGRTHDALCWEVGK